MTQGQVIDIIIMGAFSILTAYSITVFRKAHRSSEFRRNLDGNNQSICVIFLGTRKWEGDEKW